jgi:hypothetical protein
MTQLLQAHSAPYEEDGHRLLFLATSESGEWTVRLFDLDDMSALPIDETRASNLDDAKRQAEKMLSDYLHRIAMLPPFVDVETKPLTWTRDS